MHYKEKFGTNDEVSHPRKRFMPTRSISQILDICTLVAVVTHVCYEWKANHEQSRVAVSVRMHIMQLAGHENVHVRVTGSICYE